MFVYILSLRRVKESTEGSRLIVFLCMGVSSDVQHFAVAHCF